MLQGGSPSVDAARQASREFLQPQWSNLMSIVFVASDVIP